MTSFGNEMGICREAQNETEKQIPRGMSPARNDKIPTEAAKNTA